LVVKTEKMANKEYIIRLIALHVQGRLDEAGQRELREWRERSPDNETLFLKMTSRVHFDESLKICELTEEERNAEWRAIYGKTIGRRRVKWKRILRYAAVLVVTLSAGGIFLLRDMEKDAFDNSLAARARMIKKVESGAMLVLQDGTQIDLKDSVSLAKVMSSNVVLSANEEILMYSEDRVDTVVEYHTLKIPRGGEYVLVLADGSAVYLNAESELTYPVSFSGGERRVFLKGEAYFEVQKDADRPFVVEVDSLKIRVLGTEFGIRAYAEERCIRTTLKKGKVSVENSGYGVVLEPDMQAAFNKKTTRLDVRKVNVDLFLAWKDGRLVFDNCSLEDILKDLGKWYDFDVRYEREEARFIPFSLNIKKHDAFVEVLRLIEDTECVKFEIKDNTVIVK